MYIPWNANDLKQDYINTSSGHFFDDDTMKFFASKLTTAYRRIDDVTALFVTSEKKCFEDPTRVYTIRLARMYKNDSGFRKYSIETIKGLGKFKNLISAKKAMNSCVVVK